MGCGSSVDTVSAKGGAPYPKQQAPVNGQPPPNVAHPNGAPQAPHPNGAPHAPHPNGVPQAPHPKGGPQMAHPNGGPLMAHPIGTPQGLPQHGPNHPVMPHHPDGMPTKVCGKPAQVPQPDINHNQSSRMIEHRASITSNQFISEEHMEQYMDLHKCIMELEKQRVLQKLHVCLHNLQEVSQSITKLEEQKLKIEAEIDFTTKGSNVEHAGKELIKEIDHISIDNESHKKDKHEPNELQKQKEAIDMELDVQSKKYAQIEKETCECNRLCAKLLNCYMEQDNLLALMFCNAPENGDEKRLSNELQDLEDKRERMESAMRKWREAQCLLEYACKQLAYAVKLWLDLPCVPNVSLQVCYTIPDEMRKVMEESNGLQLYNEKAFDDMPACTPEEIAAIEAMASGVDQQDGNYDKSALQNCSKTHKQALMMLRCFNRVLNTSLCRDLVDVCEEIRNCSQNLRRQRIELVMKELKKKHGENFHLDIDDLCDENTLRKFMAVCKDGEICPAKNSAGKPLKVKMANLQAGPRVSIQQRRLSKGRIIEEIKAEQSKDMQKYHDGLQANREKMQEHLGKELSARKNLKIKNTPKKEPGTKDAEGHNQPREKGTGDKKPGNKGPEPHHNGPEHQKGPEQNHNEKPKSTQNKSVDHKPSIGHQKSK